ncbi:MULTISPECIES: TfoX/Sxy family protein [unclassified Microbacterium]|uniref:TfoX/Sxy family protein n=1 Tax=unclassified Microbacterium TaxID=2609290 RepID=UPI00214BDEE6|nr:MULTISPECIES: TfoX/Sxy family protein [unclassified Microbacterium]MCR2809512.1 TfoX/Sxy family protein [Microbacterium sp. zg.B185]WIM20646.1 TfoX/Sxy family protein [Microbacterium sp. zg-B185]
MPTQVDRRDLLNRIKQLLPAESVREVSMFGAVAVMVEDTMLVAVNKDGSLLVRIDPADDATLLQRSEATRAEMGAGRSMGIGWIRVDGAAAADEAILSLWVQHARRRPA